MTGDTEILDAVVVGAGQAGLGVSYFLERAGVRHRVLERGQIGESWRAQRWDAFRMNTVNAQTVMPGERYEGPDPEGTTTAHGWIALLDEFAARHHLPVEAGTPVTELAPVEGGEGAYRLATPRSEVLARNVVIASGAQNCRRMPALAGSLPGGLLQLHAADYRNAAALPPGAVLVAGAGQSGCQIAEDLLGTGRTVFLATSRVGRLPRRYRGRDIGMWMEECGMLDVRPEDLADPSVRLRGQPQLGAERTVSLQSLSVRGAVLLERLAGADKRRLLFADDLTENVRFADEASAEAKRLIDSYIARAGIAAPLAEADPAEAVAPRLPDPPILSLEPATRGVSAVIWCTGFGGDFGWVRLPGALDARGHPMHERGVTGWPGIYFTGLPWLSARRSALIPGVEHDAGRIAGLVAARRR